MQSSLNPPNLICFMFTAQCCFIDCQLYQFHYINQNKTWTEAQQYCREKHTDLATVTNMKDMKRLINISAGYKTAAWIGLYDQTNGTRTWFWSLPELEFNESETNWNPGEPSDKGIHGSENCGAVYQDLKWVDDGCQKTKYFLCYDDMKTWLKAQSYCREKHTDLISGTKQLQDEEVKKLMISPSDYTHIGLFRDTWRWSDGNSFSFRHWNNDFNYPQSNSGQYALTYCRDHHDDLVTITNMDDQRWIQEKVKNASTPFVWLGLRFNCFKNIWFWVCKEKISYQNSTSAGWMNNCNTSGAMQAGGEHRWFQRNDTEELNFICSKV
uniref:C-type lectin domain-containing protein n=1 Tax=Xiphophorus maculatus TaxID=8083 RepID=A0A3B5QLC2_XIPMA